MAAGTRVMMRSLIARILAGRALTPAEQVAYMRRQKLEQELDAGIAQRAAKRIARGPRLETKRFERARPKVEQLKLERAMQMVTF